MSEANKTATARSTLDLVWVVLGGSPHYAGRKGVDHPRKNLLDRTTVSEQRRSRRFELKLPLELVRAGSRRISHIGETRNVSSGGVLFNDPAEPIELGQPIEYMISLPTGKSMGDVRIRCMGKVVRRDGESQALAATLERYEFVRVNSATA
ncbi:PilZ domain-containing protein [Paludibaculum fermentans]|uniref:PilZ domain-containing protein n=1 Tax=Paludibaculum fermentans TaxID=1473598 RepID=UPI002B2760A2|nr:PilZ domain-containing protein [Paludibaculum fermentans]